MKTKLLSVALIFCLLITAVPFVTVAATNGTLPTNSAVQYSLSGNTLTLSGSGAVSVSGDSPWESEKATVTKVVIGEGITSVASGAFSDLTALTAVDMASTVETIEDSAFPATAFTLNGYLNHASGRYAESNSNVSLKLKEVRILTFGNSHTDDYTYWFKNILSDLETATGTTFTHEKVTSGARRMYVENATYGSHYNSATNSTASDYATYRAALEKTWDFVLIQDYHESSYSTYGGAAYADEVAATVAWLREDAAGAKIAWYADVIEPQDRGADISGDAFYDRSVAAMQAAAALTDNAPDLIIPASTVLENAYTSYFGTSVNREDVSTDYEPEGATLSILERDQAHLSHLLGRQLMGTAAMYFVIKEIEDLLPSFDYFNAIATKPTSAESQKPWNGEFLDEYWTIIEETVTNSYTAPYEVTASSYTEDPFDEKFAQVKTVMERIALTLPETLSQSVLETYFKTAAVAEELSAIEGLGTITVDDITVTYTAATSTLEEGVSVEVDCHYGLTFSTEPAYSTGYRIGDMTLVETGKLPSALGDAESMLYHIYLNADGETHTVFIHNPSATTETPDYATGSNISTTTPSMLSLPWHVSPYKETVTTFIIDDSISYLGQYLICTNYASKTTDIFIHNANARMHKNLFYDHTDYGTDLHAVHLYSSVDHSNLNYAKFYSFSYLDAEEFEETYAALWTIDETDVNAVLNNGITLVEAIEAYDSLSALAKAQLSTDTLPDSTVTYADKLTALQTVLNDNTAGCGDVNSDGTVNVIDVLITLRLLNGKNYSGDNLNLREMFLNGDRTADTADAVLLLRRVAGWSDVVIPAPENVDIQFDGTTYYYEEA